MRRRAWIYTILFCCQCATSSAQQIDNALSYKNISSEKYFRLNYENDFFSATDEYYTQGIHVELVSPSIKKFPLSKLLIHPHNTYTRFGIGLEHNGYTPSSIQHSELLYGDRPFAACLMLKSFQISTDTEDKYRLSSSIVTGVIGQAAGGAEMQTGIHRWLNNVTPQGWIYQIHNDAIINYQVDLEKQVLAYSNILSIDADAIAHVGTLSDKAALGITIMGGYFDNPYSAKPANKKHFRMYAYEHSQVNIVGYDATLQGGMFNHSSPYTVPATDITRIVLENRFGFVVVYRNVSLEYFQSYLSREFKTGSYHVWGGIQIAFSI